MTYDKAAWTAQLPQIPSADRREFHNPMSALLKRASDQRVQLDIPHVITLSKQLSPSTDKSAWVRTLVEAWDKSPAFHPRDSTTPELLAGLHRMQEPNIPKLDRDLNQLLQSGEFKDHIPEFGAFLSADAEHARERLALFSSHITGGVTALLPLSGARDGQYLAVAYNPEDITTSHVFQALKLKGYTVDEQAEAQIAAFDKYSKRELGEKLMDVAGRLSALIPTVGEVHPLSGLEQLHSQPHRWDMEALDPDGPDLGGPIQT